jgi:hypothetical protein
MQAILGTGEEDSGLSDGLIAIGLTAPEALRVEEGMRQGALVVGVEAPERVTLALQLLELSGGASLQAA